MTDESTVWRIAIRDELRATMATNPEPYWAEDAVEKDWALEHALHRPREDYVVEEVPGPLARAIADEKVRWKARRAELWRLERERRGHA
ncbi:hypothetical protein GCM10027258_62540 [Amycolatopsis stemonae]